MTTDECGGVSPRFVLSLNGLDRVQLHECSLIGTDPAVPVIVPGVADEASWSRTKQGAGSMAACTGTHGSTLKWKQWKHARFPSPPPYLLEGFLRTHHYTQGAGTIVSSVSILPHSLLSNRPPTFDIVT